ncbi:MAG: hypothetical protein ABUS57_15665 [Pseudomonadota bacterium]
MAVLAERLTLAATVALLVLGAATAWTAGHAVKRVLGVLVAQAGAFAALASLGAFDALMGGVAVCVTLLMIAAATLVRAHEAYGTLEVADIDAADAEADARTPEA